MSKLSTNRRSSSPVAFKNNLIRSRSINETPASRVTQDKYIRPDFFRPIYQKPTIVQISDIQAPIYPSYSGKHKQLALNSIQPRSKVQSQQCTPIQLLKTPAVASGICPPEYYPCSSGETDQIFSKSTSLLHDSVNRIRCSVCGMRVLADKIDSHYEIHQNYIKLEEHPKSPRSNMFGLTRFQQSTNDPENITQQPHQSLLNQLSVDITEFQIAKASQRCSLQPYIVSVLDRQVDMSLNEAKITRKKSQSRQKIEVTCKDQSRRSVDSQPAGSKTPGKQLPVQLSTQKSPIKTDYKYQRTSSNTQRSHIDSQVLEIKQKRALNILAQQMKTAQI